ncbi:hypothetical protein JB92DRAFT_2834433 [Gautieria morchelliformis]|nr:hypothetical protein JB92DRAFT_2834433 [Gautieria morchelliformis]
MSERGGIDLAALVPMIVQEFQDYYDKLTNHTFEGIPNPRDLVPDRNLVHLGMWKRRPAHRLKLLVTGRKLDDIIYEANMVLVDVALQLEQIGLGHLMNFAGLPPMYNYEWVSWEIFLGLSAAYKRKSLKLCADGLGRPTVQFAIGLLIPPGLGDTGLSDTEKQMEFACSNNGDEFTIGSKAMESNLLST